MSSEPLLLAVDVGTTGARALAVDLQGRVVHEERQAYAIRSPRPGWAEQDAREWVEATLSVLRRLAGALDSPERIVSIGLTGQCPTVVPVDEGGAPIGPGLMYLDNRAVIEAEEMRVALGEEEMHRITGHVAEPFHVGPKVLWIRANEPERFARVAKFLQPRDLVAHRLTGRFVTDQSHANATLFYDLVGRRWSPDLLARFEISASVWPEALAPWEVVSELDGSLAAELGLPVVPVVIGAADSQCAAFGAGVWEPGSISEMAGSSSCLNSSVLQPLPDLHVTHYSHAVPDRYCTELGVNTSGAALTWAVQQLGFGSYEEMESEAAAFRSWWPRQLATSSPRDVAPLFLPYLGDGERDDPTLRSAFVGLSLRHERGALAYAVFEGVALAVRRTVVDLEVAGSPVEDLRVAGGGARVPLLGQLKADALGRPVLHMDVDTAGVGVALLGAQAVMSGSDVKTAVDAIVRRARLLEPSSEADALRERIAWFDEAVASPGVHV